MGDDKGPHAWSVNRNQNVVGEGWVGPEEVTLKGNIVCEVKGRGYNFVSLVNESFDLTGLGLGIFGGVSS